MGSESDCFGLGIDALHRHEAHRWAQDSLDDRLRGRAITLLPLHERFHLGRRHKTDFVTMDLRDSLLGVQCCACLHGYNADRPLGQLSRQPRSRHRPARQDHPVRPDGAILEAALRPVDRQYFNIQPSSMRPPHGSTKPSWHR